MWPNRTRVVSTGGAVIATVNGGTSSPPTREPHVDVLDLPFGGDLGFFGWRRLHGPFVMAKPYARFGQADFDGSFASIGIGPAGNYQITSGWMGANADPARFGAGGEVAGTFFREIAAVPDATQCGSKLQGLEDYLGGASTSQPLAPDAEMINLLAQVIGNASTGPKDELGFASNAAETIFRRLATNPRPFESSALTNGCANYRPVYIAQHVRTRSDVRLATAAQAPKVRCFLTGIDGDWQGSLAAPQPLAEIYVDGNKELHLRVIPRDVIGASASCVELRR